jgi:hypothetical protein
VRKFIVSGIAQVFWALPMIKQWGRKWYYIGIAGTTVLVILYAATRVPNPLTGGRPVPTNEIGIAIMVFQITTISFLDNGTRYKNHKSTIHDLDLPYGLIDLLIENNFSVELLTNTNPSELSCILAIDQEVVKIICNAANKKNHKHRT